MKIKKKFLTSMQLMSCGMMRLKKLDITERYNGPGSLLQLAEIIKADGVKNILVVISKTVVKLGLADEFLKTLSDSSVKYIIYSEVNKSCDINSVENGLLLFQNSNCDSVIGIGGGKIIDCAKLIALRASNPSKNLMYMMDFTAVLKKSYPVYAVPTTAGSGSEISLLAFFNDSKGKKCPVLSAEFIPRACALDPDLIMSLSSEQIIYGAYDILTRAIESYIGTYSEKFYNDTQKAPKACRMIFENINKAISEPDDKNARLNLMKASYYASYSFRRACGGYIHAVSNRLEELYDFPHGKAAAILLPHFLDEYMPDIKSDLSLLSYYCGFTDNKTAELENAFKFISSIRDMNAEFNIPDKLNIISGTKLDLIVKRTQNDARYTGCPKILTDIELHDFLINIL